MEWFLVNNCLKRFTADTVQIVWSTSSEQRRMSKKTTPSFSNQHNRYTVEPRYLELAYFELPLISKWKSGPCFNMKLWQQNKIMWKRGEIAPKEQFLLFSTLFYIYISNFRSQITYSFVKCGCSIYCFPHSLNSDMSRYGYLEVFQWVPWNSR